MAESKRERSSEASGGERVKMGEKKKWPSNGNKFGPTKKLSLDLNPVWIQKQVEG
jgi:hypothetical protein